MKKVLMILVCAFFLLSLVGGVSAATLNEKTMPTGQSSQTGSARVTLDIAEGYTVIIPDVISFGHTGSGATDYTVYKTVQATVIRIEPTHYLNVTVHSNQYDTGGKGWVLMQDGADGSYKYGIKKGTDDKDHIDGEEGILANHAQILSVASNVYITQTAHLHFKYMENELPTHAGEYSDTLIFTVTVQE